MKFNPDTFTPPPYSALVVVDVQNDFADKLGSLYVQGGEQIVPLVNELAHRYAMYTQPCFCTADKHPERTPHFQKWPPHCVAETWGAQLHPELKIHTPYVKYVYKGQEPQDDGYSAFEATDLGGTPLKKLIRDQGVTHIVVAGLATDYCVKATALDGINHGFQVTVILPGCRAVNLRPSDESDAIAAMRKEGVTILE